MTSPKIRSMRTEGAASSTAAPMAAKSPQGLDKLLLETDAGFAETLLKLIDKTGKKDSDIYKRANITKQHFSKIRKDPHYQPAKTTALAFAIALELNLEQTKDLIGRAGFALTRSSKLDLIVQFYIEAGNYDLMEINMVLFANDQSLLGSNNTRVYLKTVNMTKQRLFFRCTAPFFP